MLNFSGSFEFITFKFTAITFGHTLGTYIEITQTWYYPWISSPSSNCSHSVPLAPHPPRHPMRQFWTISACWMSVSMVVHRVDVEHVFVPPKSVHRTPTKQAWAALASMGGRWSLTVHVGFFVVPKRWRHLEMLQKRLQNWIWFVFQFGDLRVIWVI